MNLFFVRILKYMENIYTWRGLLSGKEFTISIIAKTEKDAFLETLVFLSQIDHGRLAYEKNNTAKLELKLRHTEMLEESRKMKDPNLYSLMHENVTEYNLLELKETELNEQLKIDTIATYSSPFLFHSNAVVNGGIMGQEMKLKDLLTTKPICTPYYPARISVGYI